MLKFSCSFSSSSMVDIEKEVSIFSGDLMYLALGLLSFTDPPDSLERILKNAHLKIGFTCGYFPFKQHFGLRGHTLSTTAT